MSAPSRATPAGRAYLDLRNKARHDRRPVDELLQLYVLEGFLARLAASGRADQFVLKVTPAPVSVRVPRLLGGALALRGYPLAMVYAEKIVTAIARGTVSTRWRDFADVYLLVRRHAVDGTELVSSIRDVGRHRQIQLLPLAQVLDGYGEIGQQRWIAWRRRQRLEDRLPESFDEVVAAVIDFADPPISGDAERRLWDPTSGAWS